MLVNKYDVTKKMYIEWVYESKRAGKKLFFGIFWLVLFASCLILFVMYSNEYMLLIASAYCLYRGLIRDYVAGVNFYKKHLLNCVGGRWCRTITVSKKEIVIEDSTIVVKYETSDIIRTVCNDRRIRLFMKDGKSVRLYMDAFTEGKVEEYEEILKLNSNN